MDTPHLYHDNIPSTYLYTTGLSILRFPVNETGAGVIILISLIQKRSYFLFFIISNVTKLL